MLDVILWLVMLLLCVSCCFSCEVKMKFCAPDKKGADGGENGKTDDEEMSNTEKLSTYKLDHPKTPGGCYVRGAACKLMVAMIGSYVMVMMMLRLYIGGFESSLIFQPVPADQCSDSCADSSDDYCCSYGSAVDGSTNMFDTGIVTYENVTFNAGTTKLNGWLMTPPADAPQPFIPMLYCHGSGRNVAVKYRQDRYKWLLSQGIQVFSFDYPGYGLSNGKPNEATVLFSGAAAYDYLKTRSDVDTSYMMGLGRSLGGAVVTRVGVSQGRTFDAMILQSTFSSMRKLAGEGLPIGGYVVRTSIVNRFETYKYIDEFSGCLFDSHSKADEWVPFSYGKDLYDAATNAKSGCSEFLELETELHDDPMSDTEKEALTKWIEARRAEASA